MLKKTNTATSQIVTTASKTSSIPHDFEPVSRRKQDEEKNKMYFDAGDKQNSKIAQARFADDNTDDENNDDDDANENDVAVEELLHEDDGKTVID